MKILGSAVALVLVGLVSVWLWFDSAATTEQDTAGVVVTSEAPEGQPLGPFGPTPSPRTADGAVDTTAPTGPTREGNEALQREVDAARAQEAKVEAAAALVAMIRRAADETLSAAATATAEPLATGSPTPQPVQPAPVSPGLCWDDDEWEECDWDDDGDG